MSEKKETMVVPDRSLQNTTASQEGKIDLGEKMDSRIVIAVRPRNEVAAGPSSNSPSGSPTNQPQSGGAVNNTSSGSDSTKK